MSRAEFLANDARARLFSNPIGDEDESIELRGAIRAVTDPLVVVQRVVDQALELIVAAEGAVVELVDAGYLTYASAAGTLTRHIGTRLRLRDSLSGLAVCTGETLCCEDSATDGRVDASACQRVGAVSMICVPLRRAAGSIGVLKVSSSKPHAFNADDVALLTGLAQFISAAIDSATELSRIIDQLLDRAQSPPRPMQNPNRDQPRAPDDRPGHQEISRFVANVLRPGTLADTTIKKRIEHELAHATLQIACQPIVDVHSGRLVGVEALARFPTPPEQPPDVWFAQAHAAGLGVPLQLTALTQAVSLVAELPPHVYLAINLGPDAIGAAELPAVLGSTNLNRVVIELTEHLQVADYARLGATLRNLRDHGARLAIDDTGAGFASLSHVLKLAPDFIKLDRQFTSGIDVDPVRRALARALTSFASDTGARVIAEGIETAAELEVVRELGIPYGQGYFIAAPSPLAEMRRRYDHIPRSAPDPRRPLPKL